MKNANVVLIIIAMTLPMECSLARDIKEKKNGYSRVINFIQSKFNHEAASSQKHSPENSEPGEVPQGEKKAPSQFNAERDLELEKKRSGQVVKEREASRNPFIAQGKLGGPATMSKKVNMEPKIAFLFLTVSDIYHEAVWVKFFKGHHDHYSLYVHPKNDISPNSFFARAIISQREETRWENTMKAQIALLREALKDPTNTKFVFLSESTIPLVPFEEVYGHLLAHPLSEFAHEKNPDSHRKFGIITKGVRKNSQWIVLNRKHAQLMVDDTELIIEFAQHPFDNEHYPSTFLAYRKLLDEVVKKTTTLDIWKEGGPHPHLFKDLPHDPFRKDLVKGIKKKYLFARKFAPTCDLAFLHTYIPQLY